MSQGPRADAVEREVFRIIAEVCDVDPSVLDLEKSLVLCGLDSARAIDLLVALEDAFDVEIPNDVAKDLVTPGAVVAYIREHASPDEAR